MAASLTLIAASNPLVIRIQDQCDSTTFNAAVGPGTCVGDGTITFGHFIAEVTAAHKAGAWHFDPADGTVDPGTVLSLENRGGETHTFTKVAKLKRTVLLLDCMCSGESSQNVLAGTFLRPVGSLVGVPVEVEGEIVRAVVNSSGVVSMEALRDGVWISAGDPAALARGRPLSDSEIAALPSSKG